MQSGESAETDNIMKHIVTRVTDEGLVVEFYDSSENTLFDHSNKPTPLLDALMRATFRAADVVTNPVALEAHVASPPIVLANKPQWRATGERAVMARESLINVGFDPSRVARITGHADREHAVRNPMAVRNNRLELIFLRQ
jgi:chemotaxis protein MotB